jgi:uncharacterized membrane protein YgcG
MKLRVRALSEPTVEVLLNGKYENDVGCTRNYMDVYTALAGGGVEEVTADGDMTCSPELLIGLSRENALHLLSFRVIDLWFFKSLPLGSDVFDSKHHAAVCTDAMKRGITLGEVEGCWTNCRRAFMRVFGISGQWEHQFKQAWTDMQDYRIKAERTRPWLLEGWFQLALFNILLIRFLAAVAHWAMTAEGVRQLLVMFRINFKDAWLRDEYEALSRMAIEEKLLKLARPREQPGGGLGDGPNPKKIRGLGNGGGNGVGNGVGNGGGNGGGVGGGGKKNVCFEFLSTAGCPRLAASCRFLHQAVSALPQVQKDKIKALVVAKGLVPEPTKF